MWGGGGGGANHPYMQLSVCVWGGGGGANHPYMQLRAKLNREGRSPST